MRLRPRLPALIACLLAQAARPAAIHGDGPSPGSPSPTTVDSRSAAPAPSPLPAREARPGAGGFVVVLRNGGRLVLTTAPSFRDGEAVVTTPGGRRFALPEALVDTEATVLANRSAPRPKPHVFTAADLERLRSSRRVSVAAADDGSAGADAAASPDAAVLATASPATADEATWRARALGLEERAAALAARIAHLETLDSQWSSFALGMGGQYAAQAASALSDIRAERAMQEAALQQALGERSRLDDDARRSGVPPGWLR